MRASIALSYTVVDMETERPSEEDDEARERSELSMLALRLLPFSLSSRLSWMRSRSDGLYDTTIPLVMRIVMRIVMGYIYELPATPSSPRRRPPWQCPPLAAKARAPNCAPNGAANVQYAALKA